MRLTIFLLQKNRVEFDQLLEKIKTDKRILQVKGFERAILTYRNSKNNNPPWISFFGEGAQGLEEVLFNAYASAVLFLHADNDLVCLAFGPHSRHLISTETYISDFGIRCVLNAAKKNSIRSIDRWEFEGAAIKALEQATIPGSLHQFGIDFDRDHLRGAVSEPEDDEFGQAMYGKDCLSIDVDISIDKLKPLMTRLIKLYKKTKYKRDYPELGKILPVSSVVTIESLDQQLIAGIQDAANKNIHIAIPEFMRIEDPLYLNFRKPIEFEGFSFLTIDDFRTQAGRGLKSISINSLKNTRKIYAYDQNLEIKNAWSLYKCFYFETTLSSSVGSVFILSEGQWFEIRRGVVDEINSYISKIPKSGFAFPEYDIKTDKNENGYNKRCSAGIVDSQVLDAKNIYMKGTSSGIEPCDIYVPHSTFIHVKRYGASSKLSHLFFQGTNSIGLFKSSSEFRGKFNKKLSKHKLKNFDARPNDEDLTVSFLIVERKQGILSLPFFSKISLKNAAMTIRNYNVKVTIDVI